jgi:uncharacterized integral membrane protein
MIIKIILYGAMEELTITVIRLVKESDMSNYIKDIQELTNIILVIRIEATVANVTLKILFPTVSKQLQLNLFLCTG